VSNFWGSLHLGKGRAEVTNFDFLRLSFSLLGALFRGLDREIIKIKGGFLFREARDKNINQDTKMCECVRE
jgi:hypothetical protein